MEILLITDNPHIEADVRRAMDRCSVAVCRDVEMAELQLTSATYSVIVIDGSLTEASATECCRRLLGQKPQIPLFVLATGGDESVVRNTLALGPGVAGFSIIDQAGAYLSLLPRLINTAVLQFHERFHERRSITRAETQAESQAILAQIVDGSPVATFILDREHRVTYWNRACEVLTGVTRSSIIGTRDQWRAFYSSNRPVMADLIIDGESGGTVSAHYSDTWRPSDIIKGAYEAENFFPNFGDQGRWLFFTAAPLRDAEGNVTGAIETLQDVTDRRVAEAALQKKAEEEALQTSSYFQEVLDNLPFGVLVLDKALDTVYWNSRVEDLFDLRQDFIAKGMSIRDIVRHIAENGCYGPGNIDEQVAARFNTLSTFRAHSVELVRPGGGTLLVRGSPVMIADKPAGFILLQEDITERKQDELLARQQEMEKSLEVLRDAVSNINQGISMFDANLNLAVCNNLFMDLHGFPESLAKMGTPFAAFARNNAERGEYGPGDIDEIVEAKVQLAKQFQPHQFERERPDGRVIEVVGKPLPTGGFISTYTDITQRKRHEIELQEFNATLEQKIAERTETLHQALANLGATQGRLAQIVDGSPIAAYVLDQENRVTHWNRACENLTGVNASAVLGTNSVWRHFYDSERPTMADLIVSGESGNDIDRFYTGKWRRSEIIQGAFEAEDFFPNFGESGRWLYFTAAPLRNEEGNIIGAIETLRDITEQRTAESALNDRAQALQRALEDLGNVIENLEQTQDELVRSEKMAALGSMVAGVAHELNTPIGNSLMVASHLVETSRKMRDAVSAGLKKSVLDEFLTDTSSTADVLVRNLGKAAELVSSFKQVAVDQTSSQRRSFNLSAMVAEVLTTLGPSLRKTPYVVEQAIASDIVMESFPGPLGQIVTNLVNNAIIHGFDGRDTGQIRIQATKPESGQPIVLTIMDDGIGIPPNVLPKIFDPFFTTKLGQGGSGLGLNIVHNMVFGILGGRIAAESSTESGTRFILTLPLVAPAQSDSVPSEAMSDITDLRQ